MLKFIFHSADIDQRKNSGKNVDMYIFGLQENNLLSSKNIKYDVGEGLYIPFDSNSIFYYLIRILNVIFQLTKGRFLYSHVLTIIGNGLKVISSSAFYLSWEINICFICVKMKSRMPQVFIFYLDISLLHTKYNFLKISQKTFSMKRRTLCNDTTYSTFC